MKNSIYISLFWILLGCSSDDGNNCNSLPNVGVNLEVNTNLPQFSQLAFTGNGVYVSNQGINGIWLWRVSSSTLFAWEATDPNVPPSTCSRLSQSNDSNEIVTSSCDTPNRFSLSTGQPLNGNTGGCTLRPYLVQNQGDGVFFVTN